jgi:hypothetical protein
MTRAKKPQEEKLSAGSPLRIPVKAADRVLIEEAARREDPRGEIAGWSRRVLLEAARKVVRKKRE